eukprot:TRINITY_DN10875_c0_g1_i1.p1 TRINITY_DN10875_c0_g1~~TRINITY_DN10875_c0_g1_i1.p1  ORF type:complete len:2975 (+),score=482.22 TRINITY_DN10875_c0_g1_i1:924-8927(+)
MDTCRFCPQGSYANYSAAISCSFCAPGTFNALSNQTACGICSSGRYSSWNATTCTQCLVGAYQPANQQGACLLCAVGSVSNVTGLSTCLNCSIGTFMNDTGHSVCFACPRGTYQDVSGQSMCRNCSAGTFSNMTGASVCQPCAPGWASDAGKSACNACETGYFSLGNVQSCSPCGAGEFQMSSGRSSCDPCILGTAHASSGLAECPPCGYGTFANVTGATACSNCSIGTFNNVTGVSVCQQCAPGTYSDVTGALNCSLCAAGRYQSFVGQSGCSACNAGMYAFADGQSECLNCTAGTFANVTAMSACVNCSVGYFSNSTGGSACLTCTPGSSSNAGATMCYDCLPGFFSAHGPCLPCGAGEFQMSSGRSSCDPCILGTAHASSGLAECPPCGYGTFANVTGATACSNCSIGTFNNVTGVSVCQQCAPGTYSDVTGALNCSLCAAGRYQSFVGQSGCSACNAGMYAFADGQSECLNCTAGTFANVTAMSACHSCPAGNYSSQGGAVYCDQCSPGSFSAANSVNCTLCSTGSYSLHGFGACMLCAFGTFNNFTGMSSCSNCSIGSYQAAQGKTDCSDCATGTFQDQYGQASCRNCSFGSFGNTTGRTDCYLCDYGTYQQRSGKTACDACPQGTYQDALGWSTCQNCSAGMFNNVTGRSVCHVCDPGYYSMSGWSSCAVCGVGSFSVQQSADCSLCAPGSFQNTEGQSSCELCEINTYSSVNGTVNCVVCGANTYNPTGGATSSTSCQDKYISSVSPNIGRFSGENYVTISGINLGNGSDIFAVALGTVPCVIQSQSSNQVVVLTTPASVAGLNSVTVSSVTWNVTTLASAWTYRPRGQITAVVPNNSPLAGGVQVTISGSQFGNGTDVFNVTVCGYAAMILSQTTSAIVVLLAPATNDTTGDVIVVSERDGVVISFGAFTYNPFTGFITAVIPNNGPLYGGNQITVIGVDLGQNDVIAVQIHGVAVTIVSQNTTVVVVVAPDLTLLGPGSGTIRITSVAFGTLQSPNAYRHNPRGLIASVVPSTLPVAGGIVTITGTDLGGGDIYVVSVGPINVTIVSQSVLEVVVTMPPSLVVMIAGIFLDSASYGPVICGDCFAYVPDLLLSSTVPLNLTEGGTPAVITATLSAAPNSTVVIPIACATGQTSVNAATLSFSQSDYNVAHPFSVMASRDYVVDGTMPDTINLGPSVSDDPLFRSLSASLTAIAVDVDRIGVAWDDRQLERLNDIVGTGYFMTTGTVASVHVTLQSKPLSTVTISISQPDSAHVLVAPSTLTFTPNTWNVTQVVNITAVSTVSADQLLALSFTYHTSSGDPSYDSIPDTELLLVVLDSNLSGALSTLVSNAGGNTTELGGTTYMFALLAVNISNPLVLDLVSSDVTQGVVTPSTYTMTYRDLRRPVAFTITGQHDYVYHPTDIRYRITTTSTLLGVSRTSVTYLYNKEIDVFGVNVTANQLQVNKTGSADTMSMFIASKPIAPVSVTVFSSNSSLVYAQPASFVLTAANWNITQNVTAHARYNHVRDGNASVLLTLTTNSADSFYNGHVLVVRVVNWDIVFPIVDFVNPELIPMIGVNAGAYGRDFVPGVVVFVAGVVARNITWLSPYHVNFTTPPINVTGYQNVSFMNPDGGSFLAVEVFFYTSDCPQIGQWGIGLECRPCPDGGYCPGGFRVWPLPGYWNPGETSGFVNACEPPQRCRGGRFSTCAVGYQGEMCGSCIQDYYMSNSICLPCETPTFVALLQLTQSVFMIMLVVAALVAEDESLNNLQFFLQSLKVLWITGNDEQWQLPQAVQTIFWVLSLFGGDFDFIHPGCGGLSTFAQIFGLNVGVNFATLAFVVMLSHARYRFALWRASLNEELEDMSILTKFEYKRQLRIIARGASTLYQFNYEILLTRGLSTMLCMPLSGGSYLYVDTSQRCFTGVHVPVFIVGILLVAAMGASVPVVSLYHARNFVKGTRQNLMLRSYIRNQVDDYKPAYYWFGMGQLLMYSFAVCLINVIINPFTDTVSFILLMIVISVNLVLFALIRPYMQWFKNLGTVVVLFAALCSTIAGQLAAYGVPGIAGILAYLMLAILFGFLLGTVCLVLWYQFIKRLIIGRHGSIAHLFNTNKRKFTEGAPYRSNKLNDDTGIAMRHLDSAWIEQRESAADLDDTDVRKSDPSIVSRVSDSSTLLQPNSQGNTARTISRLSIDLTNAATWDDMATAVRSFGPSNLKYRAPQGDAYANISDDSLSERDQQQSGEQKAGFSRLSSPSSSPDERTREDAAQVLAKAARILSQGRRPSLPPILPGQMNGSSESTKPATPHNVVLPVLALPPAHNDMIVPVGAAPLLRSPRSPRKVPIQDTAMETAEFASPRSRVSPLLARHRVDNALFFQVDSDTLQDAGNVFDVSFSSTNPLLPTNMVSDINPTLLSSLDSLASRRVRTQTTVAVDAFAQLKPASAADFPSLRSSVRASLALPVDHAHLNGPISDRSSSIVSLDMRSSVVASEADAPEVRQFLRSARERDGDISFRSHRNRSASPQAQRLSITPVGEAIPARAFAPRAISPQPAAASARLSIASFDGLDVSPRRTSTNKMEEFDASHSAPLVDHLAARLAETAPQPFLIADTDIHRPTTDDDRLGVAANDGSLSQRSQTSQSSAIMLALGEDAPLHRSGRPKKLHDFALKQQESVKLRARARRPK